MLENECQPTTCFFDIGANVGFFTLFAAQFCSQGSVHAFDVDPDLIQIIQRNVALNGVSNIKTICAPLWHTSDRTLFFEPKQTMDKSTNTVHESFGSRVGLSSLCIDDYCEQYALQPSIVQIYVEGAEINVLQGMAKTLAGVRVLLLEVHPAFLAEFGFSMATLADQLRDYGFSFMQIKGHRRGEYGELPRSVDEITNLIENCMLLCKK